MPYDVLIQRVSDGEVRRRTMSFDWGMQDGDGWFWSEGNYSCDCNRHLEFERAAGLRPACNSEEAPCGETRYKVLRFILPDGTEIEGPDA